MTEIEKTFIIYADNPDLIWNENEEDDMELCFYPPEKLPHDANIVFDLPCLCFIDGEINTTGFVSSRNCLIAYRGISAGGTLSCANAILAPRGSIRAKKIYCEDDLIVGGDIISQEHIISHGVIECAQEEWSKHGSIIAGTGISAGGHIYAEGKIQSTTRIYAGMDFTKDGNTCDNIIRCAQLAGRGNVAYGILILGKQKKN